MERFREPFPCLIPVYKRLGPISKPLIFQEPERTKNTRFVLCMI